MRQNRRILFWIVCLLSVGFQEVAKAISTEDKIGEVLLHLDPFVESYLKKLQAPGCVIAIVSPQKVYFLKSYGVKRLGHIDPLTPDTVFQLASLSKTISAALAVKLHHQGSLSLNAPVNSYIPDFKLNGAQSSLSLKHILSHTSGISSHGANALIESCLARKALYGHMKSQKVSAQPGEKFDYHNIIYGLVEDIVVTAARQPFVDLLRDNLFNPLGMQHINLGYLPLSNIKNKAYPHEVAKKSNALRFCKKYSTCYYSISASAGMNGSIRDLIPFLQAQLGGRPEVLSPSMLKLLHTPQIRANEMLKKLKKKFPHVRDAGYSLGWRWMNYAGERVLYHGGWVKGFRPILAFLPEHNIGIAILHHAETPFSFRTMLKFLDLYLGLDSQSLSKKI